jgi:hypothetical protein
VAQDDVVRAMAKDVCTELSQADVSTKAWSQIQATLGLAMVKVVAAHQAEITASGINMTDPNVLQAFMRRVGAQFPGQCPAFLTELSKNPDIFKQAANAVVNSPGGTISGTLRKIVGGDFSYLQVEDTKGKIEKLWWMEYFQGSKTLLTDPNPRLNKPITVKYTEREVFNSTLGDYVKIKIITGIE